MKAELWDQDAEEALLGAMIVHPRAIREAQDAGVKAEHFYRPSHGIVFRAIETATEALNSIILSEILENGGSLPEVGGRPFIHTLAQRAGLAANAARYGQIIREHFHLRRLHQAGQAIVGIAESPGDVNTKLGEAENALTGAIEGAVDTRMRDIGEAMLPTFKRIAGGEPMQWLSTGLSRLDDILIGLRPGKLITLAARPGDGKSTLALNIAQHVAKGGRSVAVFSLEMSEEEIGLKLAAAVGELDYDTLVDRRRPLHATQLAKLRSVWPELRSLPLIVSDSENATMADIRAKARYLKRTRNLGLLVVDYLQLMVGGEADNRNNAVAEITRGMKMLAREIDTPILMLSQMNRAAEVRKEKRPVLSDLRDSGAIEQDSDAVVFIYRPEKYEGPGSDKAGVTELIIAKNRDGQPGWVNLQFIGRKSKFVQTGRPTVGHEQEAVAAFGTEQDA